MSKHKKAFRKKDGTTPKNPSRRKFVNQAFTLSMGAALSSFLPRLKAIPLAAAGSCTLTPAANELVNPGEIVSDHASHLLKAVMLVKDEKQDTGSAPRVRSYFPEALYVNPEIITDGDGRASISIPLADSITTWHVAMLASTVHGALGSATSSLKVFQDFFVDVILLHPMLPT